MSNVRDVTLTDRLSDLKRLGLTFADCMAAFGVDRAPETSRRMSAVETLLERGWEWNGTSWVEPIEPSLAQEAYRAGFMEACTWPEPCTQDVDSSALAEAMNSSLAKLIAHQEGSQFRIDKRGVTALLDAPLEDRVELALRDAGFSLDEASALAERIANPPAQAAQEKWIDVEVWRDGVCSIERRHASNLRKAYVQPAQAVDVGTIREVIAELEQIVEVERVHAAEQVRLLSASDKLTRALAATPVSVPDGDAARFRFVVEHNWIGVKTRCSEGIQDGDLKSARVAVDRIMFAAPSQGAKL